MSTRCIPTAALLLCLLCAPFASAGVLRQGAVQILCHRNANREAPESTLESLDLAARLGCNVIEIDIRRTLDGELVVNHDGFLDRFTDTTGDIETTELRELDRMDFGAWRGNRFRGIHLAHFDAALRLARLRNVNLYLDIKSKGLGPQILAALAREGMTQRVIFGGEWDDIRALYPSANSDDATYLQPGFTRAEVDRLHREGKIVVGNFLSNGHETDLASMRAAVAAGADALWVEYPRLGAEAAGRPVEATLARLIAKANAGAAQQRVAAIRELSYFIGFPLQRYFLRWLLDPDDVISHAAALALVSSRPAVTISALQPALHAPGASARRNAAWAIGVVAGSTPEPTPCASLLAPLLDDAQQNVIEATLIALARCPGNSSADVPATRLLALLSSPIPMQRGLAAVALAKYYPRLAAEAIPRQIDKDAAEAAAYDNALAGRGRPPLTQQEKDLMVERYRGEAHFIPALALLPESLAFKPLAEQAFRSVNDYSFVTALVAGYQLWDRLGANPQPAIAALASPDATVADRAEWALVAAGPDVLPSIRAALSISTGEVRQRLIHILAWQSDAQALPALHDLENTDPSDFDLLRWAIAKIELLETP